MNKKLLVISLAVIFLQQQGCTPGPRCLDKQSAEAVAYAKVREVLDANATLKISEHHQDGEYRLFFIEGTGDYAKPGYHWRVTVDAASCEAKVEAGE